MTIGVIFMARQPAIAVSTLAALIESGAAPVILDVRSQREFVSGHVPGALHIPVWAVWFRASELSPFRRAPLIVYCGHGPRAHFAGTILRVLGFRQVRYLRGHMSQWKRAGFPREIGLSADDLARS